MKYGGVSPDDAIRFVTINAAKQLRIDGKTGSLSRAKMPTS
jgi:imidazolonepropionase-like amidohydrolase